LSKTVYFCALRFGRLFVRLVAPKCLRQALYSAWEHQFAPAESAYMARNELENYMFCDAAFAVSENHAPLLSNPRASPPGHDMTHRCG
jgi:hypothetical protein